MSQCDLIFSFSKRVIWLKTSTLVSHSITWIEINSIKSGEDNKNIYVSGHVDASISSLISSTLFIQLNGSLPSATPKQRAGDHCKQGSLKGKRLNKVHLLGLEQYKNVGLIELLF